VIITNSSNPYVMNALQNGFSPYDYLFFPTELFPKMTGGVKQLQIEQTP